jgi:tRNA(adenine34) deaminase
LDLYTTAEPCAMCQSAVEWAGIPIVYYGTSIPYLRKLGWHQIDIRAEEVVRRTSPPDSGLAPQLPPAPLNG